MFAMVDYVRVMTTEKSCNHGERGLLEHFLILFLSVYVLPSWLGFTANISSVYSPQLVSL